MINTSSIRRRRKLRRAFRAAAVAASGTLLSSCANSLVDRIPILNPGAASYVVSTENDVASCAAEIAAPKAVYRSSLNGKKISVVNWNIRKRRHPDVTRDLSALAAEKDLVLIQEASLREDTINDNDASRHWSFVPGYRIGAEITGTMTLSKAAPLTQCSFVVLEPLLRSPKTTSITEYALSGTDETLVVINVHAVNLTFGLDAFTQQFEQVVEVLEAHEGPAILSGDFNTWRQRRTEIVQELTESLGLQSVEFADDHRVRIFGQALDHIYVRGLHAADANTEIVSSSDHNPMSVVLAVNDNAVAAD
jgi:endonuclease/exonuclease/phosphatase (EEP) superfamily protein YafD